MSLLTTLFGRRVRVRAEGHVADGRAFVYKDRFVVVGYPEKALLRDIRANIHLETGQPVQDIRIVAVARD